MFTFVQAKAITLTLRSPAVNFGNKKTRGGGRGTERGITAMANRQIKPLPLTLTAEVAATFYANNKGNTTANKISITTNRISLAGNTPRDHRIRKNTTVSLFVVDPQGSYKVIARLVFLRSFRDVMKRNTMRDHLLP